MKKTVLSIIYLLVAILCVPAVSQAASRSRRDDGKLKTVSEIEGVNLKVKSCTADDNDNVILTFTLENTNDFTDNEIYLNPYEAKAYDDEGNIYATEKSIRFARGNEQYQQGNCAISLPIEIPTKYRMRISNVDPAASVLKEIVIKIGQPLHTDQRFQGFIHLKNVPIKRSGDE